MYVISFYLDHTRTRPNWTNLQRSSCDNIKGRSKRLSGWVWESSDRRTSGHGTAFCITDFSRGKFTGLQWILFTKVSNADLKWFFVFFHQLIQAVEQTAELLVIWKTIMLMWCHCNELRKNTHVHTHTLFSILFFLPGMFQLKSSGTCFHILTWSLRCHPYYTQPEIWC